MCSPQSPSHALVFRVISLHLKPTAQCAVSAGRHCLASVVPREACQEGEMTSGCLFQLWCHWGHSLSPHEQGRLGSWTQLHRQKRKQNPYSGQTRASPILMSSRLSLPGLLPLSICVLSGHGSLCCDTGCVVISHRNSKEQTCLQWMLVSALGVMGRLLSKSVIWGSGDLRSPHLLLGALWLKTQWARESGLLPRICGRPGIHS